MKRPINTNIKSYRINDEREKPSRWSFTKVLREYSTLREFYPEITPYHEVYKFRDNMYAIFSEGLSSGTADMWNYLVIGPKKAMLIDTGYGVGNLRALCEKLAPGKEIIPFNTHQHGDHISGNYWFDKCYCHENDKEGILANMKPGFLAGRILNEKGEPKDTYFDVKDMPDTNHVPEMIGVESHHIFDLGDGYEMEVWPLWGHTPGQSAILDKQSMCIYIGDTTSVRPAGPNEKHPECCTVKALRDCLLDLEPLFDSITAVFPGHGIIDMHALYLQYLMDTCNRVLEHPDWYDSKTTFGGKEMLARFIYQQGSDLKYTMDSVE